MASRLSTFWSKEVRKTAEIIINKIDSRIFLGIGTEQIEISDYNVKSSANGITELGITISGKVNVFEMSASLEEQRKLNPMRSYEMVGETNLCDNDNFGSAFSGNENSRLAKVHDIVSG